MKSVAEAAPVVFTVADFDRGAERLLAVIESSCDPDANFVEQLDAALCACLDLLAGDRQLALLLAAPHVRQRELRPAHERWARTYSLLLRQAAERIPPPAGRRPFSEPYLIGAVSWKIRSRVEGGVRQSLPLMRLDLLQLLLPYYLGTEESDRLVGPGDLRALGYFNGRKPATPAESTDAPLRPLLRSGAPSLAHS